MTGVKQYRDDLRAANDEIKRLREQLAACGAGTSTGSNKPVSYDPAAKMSGTNAEKIAKLSRQVVVLQTRLRRAGLSAEV